MRDAIARTLTRVLALLVPCRPGRHSARYLAARTSGPITASGPAPALSPANPWSRPWTGPTKEQAAAFFRRQGATTPEQRRQRERRRALYYATRGIDFPYTYEGAPFPLAAFASAAGGDA
ncbi:hypothetical protein OFY01_01980 [Streptomyces sp. GXMU-J5]|uniref:Uncharacterized protein n=1 Tax=Streptomyces beihaiensis TaxID=2984495 RepID=A0ABT3TNJ2_9ACTN|nr:hypothetical protein [Streptomyces beihaiensis]